MTNTAALAAEKVALRAQAKVLRQKLDPALGEQLARHVLKTLPPPAGAVVAGYWPFGSEIDVRPLLFALAEQGHPLALPETLPLGEALLFRQWAPGEALVNGRYGTLHPIGTPVVPDVVLVPLLAFDGRGARLGYGGGFYDRALAGLPDTLQIGCAYSAQEVPAVPVGAHDMPLDAVATERGVRRF